MCLAASGSLTFLPYKEISQIKGKKKKPTIQQKMGQGSFTHMQKKKKKKLLKQVSKIEELFGSKRKAKPNHSANISHLLDPLASKTLDNTFSWQGGRKWAPHPAGRHAKRSCSEGQRASEQMFIEITHTARCARQSPSVNLCYR